MSAGDPRIEFRPGSELRDRLEQLRQEVSRKAGRNVRMGELVKSVLAQFLEQLEHGDRGGRR